MAAHQQATTMVPEEDELNVINVISIQLIQEASQTQDLNQVVALSLHGRNIVKLQALSLCPNLRTLDLSFNCIRRLEGLETLVKLKELKLYDNHISSLQGLAGLQALHTLDVSGNKLTSLQGVAGLRGLRVLRCAHNPHLTSLDGLGRAGAIEVLDLSHCSLSDLSGLTAAVSLKELHVAGNKLTNLKGLQRCDQLQELHAAFNALSSLHGLKPCAATLDVLDVRGNRLTSLDTLAEGCINLHELYAADNSISSLSTLAAQAPALETLDVARNQLHLGNSSSDAVLQQLVIQLSGLTELSWLHVEGNPGGQGYQAALLAALAQLDGVDEQARPAVAHQADVWMNPADAGPDPELTQLLSHVEAAALLPTVDEMEAYKQAMGINSQLPTIGLQQPHQHNTSQGSSSTGDSGEVECISGADGSRPATATRESLSSRGRPGSALPRAQTQRTGSAMGLQGAGGTIKDVMMHQRKPSARTGANKRLMTPDQYAQAVADFGGTMAKYSTALQAALATMKSGLKLSIVEAAQQIRTPEGIAARQLPVMPIMPAMPSNMTRDKVLGPAGNALLTKPQELAPPSLAGAGSGAGHAWQAQGSPAAAQKVRAAELAAVRGALHDPGAEAALEHFQRLYPAPSQELQVGVAAGRLKTAKQQQGVVAANIQEEDSACVVADTAKVVAAVLHRQGSGVSDDRDMLICDDGVGACQGRADDGQDSSRGPESKSAEQGTDAAHTVVSAVGDELRPAYDSSAQGQQGEPWHSPPGSRHDQDIVSAAHTPQPCRAAPSTVVLHHLSAGPGPAGSIQPSDALVWKGGTRPLSAGHAAGGHSKSPAGGHTSGSAASQPVGDRQVSLKFKAKPGKLNSPEAASRNASAVKAGPVQQQQQAGVIIARRGMKARLPGQAAQ